MTYINEDPIFHILLQIMLPLKSKLKHWGSFTKGEKKKVNKAKLFFFLFP